ncbi:MAG: sulfatase-like hydrolase/transferase [Chloroflexi bacterium]|nr:sulfatase-like hydrolase/transferase [Chloroflexota bacterium]
MSDSRPNVLWLMTDEQRTDSLGCYGSPWAVTPHLDRLAGQGALFCHAVTPAPVCVPARVALLTGLYPSHTGVWYNHDHRQDLPLLTDPFREAGYATACFGKQGYHTARPAFAVEERLVLSEHVHYFHYAAQHDGPAHGMVRYPYEEGEPWILGGRFPAPADETAEAAAARAAQSWLGALPTGSPFFLSLATNAPHTPVVPPAPYDALIRDEDIGLPADDTLPRGRPAWVGEDVAEVARADRFTPGQIAAIRRSYYGEVAYLDALLGGLLDWMAARGLLENTIVALTCDHGTHLGDFGLVQKQTFYEPVVSVPLILWYPRAIPAGGMYETPVETLSLLPTLLDLAGLPAPQSDGPSLAGPLTRGCEPEARPVFSEFTLGSYRTRPEDRLVMVRDGRWKASCCLDPYPHDVDLCDLEADPQERRNLHGDPSCAEVEEHLLGLIAAHIGG